MLGMGYGVAMTPADDHMAPPQHESGPALTRRAAPGSHAPSRLERTTTDDHRNTTLRQRPRPARPGVPAAAAAPVHVPSPGGAGGGVPGPRGAGRRARPAAA